MSPPGERFKKEIQGMNLIIYDDELGISIDENVATIKPLYGGGSEFLKVFGDGVRRFPYMLIFHVGLGSGAFTLHSHRISVNAGGAGWVRQFP